MKRVFIAVDISDDARRAAASHVEKLRREFRDTRVNWVRAENMHITLTFLGEVYDEIERISSGLKRVADESKAFETSLGKPLAFGRQTLVIGVADSSGSFAELSRLNENECQKLGFDKEARPFRQHVTIGRIREKKGTAGLIAAHRNAKVEPISFEVNSLILYESQLQPTGSVYLPLGRFPLRKS